jgi:hypothetical protein
LVISIKFIAVFKLLSVLCKYNYSLKVCHPALSHPGQGVFKNNKYVKGSGEEMMCGQCAAGFLCRAVTHLTGAGV